eukprot:2650109-Amphidinium_carterae.1
MEVLSIIHVLERSTRVDLQRLIDLLQACHSSQNRNQQCTFKEHDSRGNGRKTNTAKNTSNATYFGDTRFVKPPTP